MHERFFLFLSSFNMGSLAPRDYFREHFILNFHLDDSNVDRGYLTLGTVYKACFLPLSMELK